MRVVVFSDPTVVGEIKHTYTLHERNLRRHERWKEDEREGAAKKMERLPKRMANLECNEQNMKVKHRVEGNRLFNGRRDE